MKIEKDHPSEPYLLRGIPVVFAFWGFWRDHPLQNRWRSPKRTAFVTWRSHRLCLWGIFARSPPADRWRSSMRTRFIMRYSRRLCYYWKEYFRQNLLDRLTLDHRVHRVATAAFWRTFSHEGKICPAGEGGGCTPTPSHYIYHHQ